MKMPKVKVPKAKGKAPFPAKKMKRTIKPGKLPKY